MTIKIRQTLIIGVVLIICATLFIMGFKSSSDSGSTKSDKRIATTFDEASYIAEAQTKLSGTLAAEVKLLEKDLSNKGALVKLANIWDSMQVSYVSAFYTQKIAEMVNDEVSWLATGNKYYTAANFSNDSSLTFDAIKKAKNAYSKVLGLNPNNLQAKNALAVCIIQGDNDVMKGVAMLKEIVAADSSNTQAIFTLGMLSIQSNQFDKAQERFEKLIKLEPFNPEYYFYLGEVYAKSGDTKKAIKTYETCKTLVSDKKAKEEIDIIIEKLTKL
ncbi:MAG: tetratricopeptide repeat protein [Bacteroidia bacterium]|jgi:tetratricopeptide (TPR) repeat protein|nr:tetratricopeptide repeat protein [Bacteroidia bacterium]